jgi:hypothetical protein
VKIGDKGLSGQDQFQPPRHGRAEPQPLRVVNGATVYLKDVAQVRDGIPYKTSVVRTNGRRGACSPSCGTVRHPHCSRQHVKAALPKILAGLPSALR